MKTCLWPGCCVQTAGLVCGFHGKVPPPPRSALVQIGRLSGQPLWDRYSFAPTMPQPVTRGSDVLV